MGTKGLTSGPELSVAGREHALERAERGEATWAGRGGKLGRGKERERLGPCGEVVWAAAR